MPVWDRPVCPGDVSCAGREEAGMSLHRWIWERVFCPPPHFYWYLIFSKISAILKYSINPYIHRGQIVVIYNNYLKKKQYSTTQLHRKRSRLFF